MNDLMANSDIASLFSLPEPSRASEQEKSVEQAQEVGDATWFDDWNMPNESSMDEPEAKRMKLELDKLIFTDASQIDLDIDSDEEFKVRDKIGWNRAWYLPLYSNNMAEDYLYDPNEGIDEAGNVQDKISAERADISPPRNDSNMVQSRLHHSAELVVAKANEALDFNARSDCSFSSSAKETWAPFAPYAGNEKFGEIDGDKLGFHGSDVAAEHIDYRTEDGNYPSGNIIDGSSSMIMNANDAGTNRGSNDHSNDGDNEDNGDEYSSLGAASRENAAPAHNTPTKKQLAGVQTGVQTGLSSNSNLVPAEDVAKPKRKYVKKALPKDGKLPKKQRSSANSDSILAGDVAKPKRKYVKNTTPKDETPPKEQSSSANSATASSGSFETGSDGIIRKKRGRPIDRLNDKTIAKNKAAEEEAAKANATGGNCTTTVAGPSGANSFTNPSYSPPGTTATPSPMNSSPSQRDMGVEEALAGFSKMTNNLHVLGAMNAAPPHVHFTNGYTSQSNPHLSSPPQAPPHGNYPNGCQPQSNPYLSPPPHGHYPNNYHPQPNPRLPPPPHGHCPNGCYPQSNLHFSPANPGQRDGAEKRM